MLFLLFSLLLSFSLVRGQSCTLTSQCPQINTENLCSMAICELPAGICKFIPCTPLGLLCKSDGGCLPCFNDTECPASPPDQTCKVGHCFFHGACGFKTCKEAGVLCNQAGTCISCITNSQCGLGERCNEQGLCISTDSDVNSSSVWLAIAFIIIIIIVVVIIIIAVTRWKKRKTGPVSRV